MVLDENVQAEGSDYCDIADVSPSPGAHDLAAYAADMTGYEVGRRPRIQHAPSRN